MNNTLTEYEIKQIQLQYLLFIDNPTCHTEEGDTPDGYEKSGYINMMFEPESEFGSECVLVLQKNNKYYFKFYYDTVCFRLDSYDDEYVNWLEPYSSEDDLEEIYKQFKNWVLTKYHHL